MNSTESAPLTLNSIILVITLVGMVATIVLAGLKLRATLCRKGRGDTEKGEAKLRKKERDRIYKIHHNLELLVENAGLEKTSVS